MNFIDLSIAWEDLPLTCCNCETLKPAIAFIIDLKRDEEGQWCKKCQSERSKKYRRKPEVKQKMAIASKKWKAANKDKSLATIQQWQRKNGKLLWKKYRDRKTKLGITRHERARHRASLLQRTPSWLVEADWAAIKALYKKAKQLSLDIGVPHEVDHILPLRGKNISGLHVPANLRIITQVDNRKKSNK